MSNTLCLNDYINIAASAQKNSRVSDLLGGLIHLFFGNWYNMQKLNDLEIVIEYLTEGNSEADTLDNIRERLDIKSSCWQYIWIVWVCITGYTSHVIKHTSSTQFTYSNKVILWRLKQICYAHVKWQHIQFNKLLMIIYLRQQWTCYGANRTMHVMSTLTRTTTMNNNTTWNDFSMKNEVTKKIS